MALGTFVHEGDTIDYTPDGTTPAGTIVEIVDIVGMAINDIAAGVKGALQVKGVVTWPKAITSGSAIVAGDTVYWDDGSSVVTATSDSNTEIGKCVLVTVDADDTVNVRLDM